MAYLLRQGWEAERGAGGGSLDELGVRSVGALQKALPGLAVEQGQD